MKNESKTLTAGLPVCFKMKHSPLPVLPGFGPKDFVPKWHKRIPGKCENAAAGGREKQTDNHATCKK